MPATLAAAIGLKPGELIELNSRRGPQAVTARGLQPSLGSVRRFVEGDGLQVGDAVFLTFTDANDFDIELVSNEGTSLTAAALSLIGVQASDAAQPLSTLANAVGASLQGGLAGLIDAYRTRGDDDVAELLELM
jgi:hypothetical protein